MVVLIVRRVALLFFSSKSQCFFEQNETLYFIRFGASEFCCIFTCMHFLLHQASCYSRYQEYIEALSRKTAVEP